jgi:hypothetical protein
MAFNVEATVAISQLSSLLEVGVGVNLGLVLIDGVKKYLTTFGETIINRADDVLRVFLPCLETGTSTSGEAVRSIQLWVKVANGLKNLICSEWLFLVLKALCILVSLLFVILLAVTPYVAKNLLAWEVVSVAALAVFPVVVATAHFLLALLLSVVIYAGGKLLQWRYKPLIDQVNELGKRNVP